ncbi:hypothetical protein TW95_gp0957 [Pandoravirus inopinatum]|uniref:Uncharacterized protein n=1 Tax=Pandoravirus inopinatum TaxID=1605721 RepID=A0A0B5JA01_9VIRU|nr:hypothetical protein TW95_gp0957 [Pandoravirus inopinatum]AJF97691.1 hypothetical protein [Pandoravirus inopinatum]
MAGPVFLPVSPQNGDWRQKCALWRQCATLFFHACSGDRCRCGGRATKAGILSLIFCDTFRKKGRFLVSSTSPQARFFLWRHCRGWRRRKADHHHQQQQQPVPSQGALGRPWAWPARQASLLTARGKKGGTKDLDGADSNVKAT